MEKRLRFLLVTPRGIAYETDCREVQLVAADDSQGRGGGSIGIRYGHTETVVVLQPGKPVRALGGETPFSAVTGGGVARVRNNTVTVLAESAEIPE